MTGQFPETEGTRVLTAVADRAPIRADKDWRQLAAIAGDGFVFNYSLLHLVGRLEHNLLAEFEAETKLAPEAKVFVYDRPLFQGLLTPFDRLLWWVPAAVWPRLYAFVCSVSTYNPETRFCAEVIAQRLPVTLGETPVDVTFFAVSTTEGVYHMQQNVGSSPYLLTQSPADPKVKTLVDPL